MSLSEKYLVLKPSLFVSISSVEPRICHYSQAQKNKMYTNVVKYEGICIIDLKISRRCTDARKSKFQWLKLKTLAIEILNLHNQEEHIFLSADSHYICLIMFNERRLQEANYIKVTTWNPFVFRKDLIRNV